jgi:hypothetical protein
MPQSHEYPNYLDAIELGEERSIRGRIDELKAELQNLTKALEHARRAKRILWVAGKELEGEVVRFLSDLRLQIRPLTGPPAIGASERSGARTAGTRPSSRSPS